MVREAKRGDLDGLLNLYVHLHGESVPGNIEKLQPLWETILGDRNHHILIDEREEEIVSSCVLLVVPNLTHGQRPYGFIENVVTDPAFRKQGLATACLNYARELARRENCYKLMLMTGSKEDSTLRFYERAGYNRADKTAFVQWLD